MFLVVLVILVCGLAALVYFVSARRHVLPLEAEQERDKHERFLRDVPPPPG